MEFLKSVNSWVGLTILSRWMHVSLSENLLISLVS